MTRAQALQRWQGMAPQVKQADGILNPVSEFGNAMSHLPAVTNFKPYITHRPPPTLGQDAMDTFVHAPASLGKYVGHTLAGKGGKPGVVENLFNYGVGYTTGSGGHPGVASKLWDYGAGTLFSDPGRQSLSSVFSRPADMPSLATAFSGPAGRAGEHISDYWRQGGRLGQHAVWGPLESAIKWWKEPFKVE